MKAPTALTTIGTLLFALAFCVTARAEEEEKDTKKKYEATLYELGAFPVDKLSKTTYGNFKVRDGHLYLEDKQIDLNGWLSPSMLESGNYLTPEDSIAYQLRRRVLPYKMYISFLDFETYKETEDPLLFTIIYFTLQELRLRKVPIADVGNIIVAYEAKIGVEHLALRLLRGKISGAEGIAFYKKHKDPKILDILPVPGMGDTDYIARLAGIFADRQLPNYDRFLACFLLFRMDGREYRKPIRDFLFQNLESEGNWENRGRMYKALFSLYDLECFPFLNKRLLADPAAECRITILHQIYEFQCEKRFVDSLILLVHGQCEPYHPRATEDVPEGDRVLRLAIERLKRIKGEVYLSDELKSDIRKILKKHENGELPEWPYKTPVDMGYLDSTPYEPMAEDSTRQYMFAVALVAIVFGFAAVLVGVLFGRRRRRLGTIVRDLINGPKN